MEATRGMLANTMHHNIEEKKKHNSGESIPYFLGLVDVDGVRKSGKLINRGYEKHYATSLICAYRKKRHPETICSFTRSQADKRHTTDAEKAEVKEITQICDRGTKKVIDKTLMNLHQLRRLINSALILDDKYDINGVSERLKSRPVARGNEIDDSLYEDRYSPTVHVMILLLILAKERQKYES